MARKVSDFVRVALEGATIDNRKITRKQIEQMASNYDPVNRYGARIWMEHLRSLFADEYAMFPALGDVLELKSKEKDGKMGLYARLSPTDKLIKMNQNRQKVYTSIEMDPSYADTGEAYMVGLAVTDTPASQGTEMLAFSQQNDKFSTDHSFSEFMEAELTFTEEKEDEPGLLDRVRSLFSSKQRTDEQRFSDVDQAVTEIAGEVVAQEDRFNKALADKADSSTVTELSTKLEQVTKDFNELKDQLDKEEKPDHYKREKATGVDGGREKAKF